MIPDLFSPLCAPFRLEGDNGEAVVLSHGFTGVPAHFRPMADFLNERGYTVNVPLLAGHGTTMEDMATTGAEDWVRSVSLAARAVADHRRVHLVGLSMGGLISLIVAGEAAAATVTTINTPIVARDRKLYLAALVHRLHPKAEWPEEPPPPLDPEVMPFWLTYPGFYTRTAADLVRLMGRGYWAARRLRRPSLVVQSRTDETVDPRSAVLLARALGPGCRLVWLESSLHNALLDHERASIHAAVLDCVSR